MKILGKNISDELLRYVFWGVVTSAENILLYGYLVFIGLDYKIANFITLILVKLTAYLVNKIFVFKSKTVGLKELLSEFIRFFMSRLFTFFVEFIGLLIMIEILYVNSYVGKVLVTVIVVVINYVIGKKHVFKNK